MARRDSNDQGEFRVTLVGVTGVPTTKKFTSRIKARRYFDAHMKMTHIQYGVMLDIGDIDPVYWRVIDQRTQNRVRTIGDP